MALSDADIHFQAKKMGLSLVASDSLGIALTAQCSVLSMVSGAMVHQVRRHQRCGGLPATFDGVFFNPIRRYS